MRYLDPSTDLVFKLLFRDPSDEPRLIAMLTAILEPDSPIVSAKVQNPELPADVLPSKNILLDLLVALADGRRINVEMETWPRPVFDLRNLATDDTVSPALRRWAEFFDHPTTATLERLAKEDDIMADTVDKLARVSLDDPTFYLAEARRRAAFAEWDNRRYDRAEGRAEGEQAALRAAVVGVLTARFGAVSEDVRARIGAQPVVELHRLIARAATVASMDELELG